jgi:hypothetical protein
VKICRGGAPGCENVKPDQDLVDQDVASDSQPKALSAWPTCSMCFGSWRREYSMVLVAGLRQIDELRAMSRRPSRLTRLFPPLKMCRHPWPAPANCRCESQRQAAGAFEGGQIASGNCARDEIAHHRRLKPAFRQASTTVLATVGPLSRRNRKQLVLQYCESDLFESGSS